MKSILLAASLAPLAACALTPNGPQHAMSVAETHPITVDQQAVALRVPVDASRAGLGRGDLARLDGLVTDYRTRGHGPITVTAPVGAASDRAAQQTAADVRAALHAFGVPYEAMNGASMTTRGGGDVVVSFQTYVATAPACGRAGSEVATRLRNIRTASFGCAAQVNLAAMIADPRDLHAGGAADGTGGESLVKAVTSLNEAEAPQVTYQASQGGGGGGGE